MKITAQGEKSKQSPIEHLAAFIVDKRKAFYLLYIGLAIFCVFASGWVQVNDALTDYLPEETETRRGLTVMDEEFTTFGTNRIMVDNIPFARAEELSEKLAAIPGVKSVAFDGTEDHYKDGAALFSVTYDGEAADQVSLDALAQVKETLSGYDLYITGDTGSDDSASLDAEMQVVMVIAVVIILLVLLFTSQTYMEIPVLLVTFGMAALLNKGTNFLFGEISFVSNSVAVVLQLALAIDYAIILCHRYTEERAHLDAREATITALSKAIPEIAGSSMTTLSGLGAMCFMQFRIGYDLGLVLMKAIVLSLLSVFTLMPGLLMSFSSLIDRTHHRNFVPKITAWGRLSVKTRYIVPPIFVVLLIGGFIFSNQCPYVYGMTTLSTYAQNDTQIAQQKVDGTFGGVNTLAVLVPTGDYETEGRLLRELEAGKIVIVAGFQGIDRAGDLTTLGRGGSDTTAVALAAALDACGCRICTDVDGVYSGDPRRNADCQRYDYIPYEEMLEMANAGAKVLHPRSVALAQRYRVPLSVLQTGSETPCTVVGLPERQHHSLAADTVFLYR